MPAPEHTFATAPKKTARPAPPAAPPAVTLSVVVVNFRQISATTQLVEQLTRSVAYRDGQAEVVLVDNDADPKPLKNWSKRHRDVRLKSFGCNRGFARAVNEGCAVSGGDWLLLLNPDVGVPDEFLDQVMQQAWRRAQADPRTGVIGFGLDHADGSHQPSAGDYPTLANVVAGTLKSRAYRRCQLMPDEATEVPWVTGCCLLIRRDCWQELGGFDEDYFLYYEDVDLCKRATDSGWTVWHEPSLRVTHFHPLHSRSVAPPLRIITRHALLTYAQKHWRNWQFRWLTRLVRGEANIRRWWAWLRGDAETAEHFQRLRDISRDLLRGRSVRARHRLGQAASALTTKD